MPVDDGACGHLAGMPVPSLTLDSSLGPVSFRELGLDLAVLYVYPRTGRPDRPTPGELGRDPGRARLHAAVVRLPRPRRGARRAGRARRGALRADARGPGRVRRARTTCRFPVIADPERKLGAALGLPTFEFEGMELYKRVTLSSRPRGVEGLLPGVPARPERRRRGRLAARADGARREARHLRRRAARRRPRGRRDRRARRRPRCASTSSAEAPTRPASGSPSPRRGCARRSSRRSSSTRPGTSASTRRSPSASTGRTRSRRGSSSSRTSTRSSGRTSRSSTRST